MTAEVAILNKSAVALAADSAVTISIGDKEEKTFDSADKLFELCRFNPIGIMVYNGLSFAEVPIQSVIKQYRSSCGRFDNVRDAALHFLQHLNHFAQSSPQRVQDDSIKWMISPVVGRIYDRFVGRLQQRVFDKPRAENLEQDIKNMLDESIDFYEAIYENQGDAKFVGGPPTISDREVSVINHVVKERFPFPQASEQALARIADLAKTALRKDVLTDGRTGIVIAGFGTKELFPTLMSFEIDGMVGGHLKYVETNFVDIDRSGPRARVLPFAQKEMMDRFMYGMDDGIEKNITDFCESTVPAIRKAIIDRMEFTDENDKQGFEAEVISAERTFVSGLGQTAFTAIRKASEGALEAMVEFMPKPELARMAEALVNLTSIKRRVSRGMETVGGPIDVAVISQAEGFVWVKRKHYFPSELNARYFERVRDQMKQNEERLHAAVPKPRSARKRGRSEAKEISGSDVKEPVAGREIHPAPD